MIGETEGDKWYCLIIGSDGDYIMGVTPLFPIAVILPLNLYLKSIIILSD
jgi:hypothetical protein